MRTPKRLAQIEETAYVTSPMDEEAATTSVQDLVSTSSQ